MTLYRGIEEWALALFTTTRFIIKMFVVGDSLTAHVALNCPAAGAHDFVAAIRLDEWILAYRRELVLANDGHSG